MAIMRTKQQGFTLVETMITLVVSMVILGGLLLNFTSQSTQYKYQDKRLDAAQDLDFALRLISRDLESALLSENSAALSPGVGTDVYTIAFDSLAVDLYTSYLSFYTWSEDASLSPAPAAPSMRVLRCYIYDNTSTQKMIKVDQSVSSCGPTTTMTASKALLGETLVGLKGLQVTHFRVFDDYSTPLADRYSYVGIPDPLPRTTVRDIKNNPHLVPGFTILIEVEVDAVSKSTGATDVFGNAVTAGKRRLWRYSQVYPNAVVLE